MYCTGIFGVWSISLLAQKNRGVVSSPLQTRAHRWMSWGQIKDSGRCSEILKTWVDVTRFSRTSA